MPEKEQFKKVSATDTFIMQYQIDAENIRYAKEIQWRIPSVLVAIDSAVIAALSFWKQPNSTIPKTTAVLLIIALGLFGGLGMFLLNGVRMNLKGYRNRQNAISTHSFANEFHRYAIKPQDYIRNKWIDILFQASFSTIICLSWVALSLMLLGVT